MKRIKLSNNTYTLVDDEDFNYLDQCKWASLKGAAMRSPRSGTLYMHRVMLNNV